MLKCQELPSGNIFIDTGYGQKDIRTTQLHHHKIESNIPFYPQNFNYSIYNGLNQFITFLWFVALMPNLHYLISKISPAIIPQTSEKRMASKIGKLIFEIE